MLLLRLLFITTTKATPSQQVIQLEIRMLQPMIRLIISHIIPPAQALHRPLLNQLLQLQLQHQLPRELLRLPGNRVLPPRGVVIIIIDPLQQFR